MKTTTMKKALLGFVALLLISLFGFNQEVKAQVSDEDDATVTATVLTAIAVENILDIVFGPIIEGQTATLNPLDRSTSTGVGPSAALGKFRVTGAAGASVLIEFDSTVVMDNDDPLETSTLEFEPTAARTNDDSDEEGDVAVSNNSSYTINTVDDGPDVVSGIDYIFIGGSISVAPGTSGSFTGTMTLTASYN